MNDRPTAGELIDAVRLFLEKDLLPSLTDPRMRFQTLIAAHALAMTQRERSGEEARLREEWALLGGTGDAPVMTDLISELRRLEAGLCRAIAAGDYDEPGKGEELRATLRTLTADKLAVANPAYIDSSGLVAEPRSHAQNAQNTQNTQ